MKKIYVTGQLRGIDNVSTKRNRHALSLVCRKILISENFPICPLLSCEDWYLDPRLPSNDSWWVHNYLVDFMKDCDEFCYVEVPSGVECHRLEIEKNIWQVIGNTPPVPASMIIQHIGGFHGKR